MLPGDITESDEIIGVGVVTNPCEWDIVYTSTSGCLVSGINYTDSSGDGGGVAPMCSMALTDFTVPAESSINESYSLGTLPAGDYTLTVDFGGPAPSPETVFTVVGTTAAMVPDFSLPDINPLSPSYGSTISPRDLVGQVTGWYFIKAT